MKVKELIEELHKYNPEAKVHKGEIDFEHMKSRTSDIKEVCIFNRSEETPFEGELEEIKSIILI